MVSLVSQTIMDIPPDASYSLVTKGPLLHFMDL